MQRWPLVTQTDPQIKSQGGIPSCCAYAAGHNHTVYTHTQPALAASVSVTAAMKSYSYAIAHGKSPQLTYTVTDVHLVYTSS